MISWNDNDYPIVNTEDGSATTNKNIDSNHVDLNSFGNTEDEMNIYTSVLGYFEQFTSTKDNLNKVNKSSDIYEYNLAKINRDVNNIHLYNDQILKENANYWKINEG